MSYTQTHAVARTIECRTCAVTVSGDDVSDLGVAMFRSLHGDGHDVTDTAEGGTP